MAMACFLAAGNAAARRFAGTTLRRSGLSSATARHDDAKEAVKWERITYAGIGTCTVLAVYNLSKGHQEFPDPPPYPYLHIRNKDFPWGPDGLFERKKKHSNEATTITSSDLASTRTSPNMCTADAQMLNPCAL